MLFSFNAYSSLLLVFFIHILIFSILFLYRGITRAQNACKWMSGFLLMAALYVCPWMLGFAGWYDSPTYKQILLYVPFQQLLLLGPVIYCYVRSQLSSRVQLHKREIIHLLPGIGYLLYTLFVFVHDKWIDAGNIILSDQLDPDFDTWYQYAGFISLPFYAFLSLWYYRRYRRLVVAVLSDAYDFTFSWIGRFLIVVSAMPVVWLAAQGYNAFFSGSYESNWWYFLVFAIGAYYISIAAYANAVESKVFFSGGLFVNNESIQFYIESPRLTLRAPQELILNNMKDFRLNDYIQNKTLDQWKNEVENLMLQQRLFEDPELSLVKVASLMNVNISVLSRIINQGFGKNFNDFVNEHRVNDFKLNIHANKHHRETLLSLAFGSGFNSKSTFNRVFKKFTGLTPQQYVREQAPGKKIAKETN